MVQEHAAAKIKRSWEHKTLSASDLIYNPGDYTLIQREKIVNDRIYEFLAKITALVFDPPSKIVIVDQNGSKNQYTVDQIRPYFS